MKDFSDAPSWVPSGGSSLDALIARVEAATGPDGEMDCRILSALLSSDQITAVRCSAINGAWCAYTTGYSGRERLWETPAPFSTLPGVTASLDAALALVKRVLPSAYAGVQQNAYPLGEPEDRSWNGYISYGSFEEHEGTCRPTPALAVLAALLRALQAQPDRHNARDGASQ